MLLHTFIPPASSTTIDDRICVVRFCGPFNNVSGENINTECRLCIPRGQFLPVPRQPPPYVLCFWSCSIIGQRGAGAAGGPVAINVFFSSGATLDSMSKVLKTDRDGFGKKTTHGFCFHTLLVSGLWMDRAMRCFTAARRRWLLRCVQLKLFAVVNF